MSRVQQIASARHSCPSLGQVSELADQNHDHDAAPTQRLYADIASWWPLISAPEEYIGEASFAASLLRTANPSRSHGARTGKRGR